VTWKSPLSAKFSAISRPYFHHPLHGSLASFQAWGTPGGGSWNVLITGPPSWGFDVPLATALCRNLRAENTQR